MIDTFSLILVSPEILLLVMACVVALVDLGVRTRLRDGTYVLTMLTLAVVAWFCADFAQSGVTSYAFGKMIVSEPWGLKAFFAQRPVAYWGVVVAVTLLILVAGHLAHRRNRRAAIEELNARLGEAEAPAVSEPSEH